MYCARGVKESYRQRDDASGWAQGLCIRVCLRHEDDDRDVGNQGVSWLHSPVQAQSIECLLQGKACVGITAVSQSL